MDLKDNKTAAFEEEAPVITHDWVTGTGLVPVE